MMERQLPLAGETVLQLLPIRQDESRNSQAGPLNACMRNVCCGASLASRDMMGLEVPEPQSRLFYLSSYSDGMSGRTRMHAKSAAWRGDSRWHGQPYSTKPNPYSTDLQPIKPHPPGEAS